MVLDWLLGAGKLQEQLFMMDARVNANRGFFGDLSTRKVKKNARELSIELDKYRKPVVPYSPGEVRNDNAVIGVQELVCELNRNTPDIFINFPGYEGRGSPLKKRWMRERDYLVKEYEYDYLLDPKYDPREDGNHVILRLSINEAKMFYKRAEVNVPFHSKYTITTTAPIKGKVKAKLK